ncbi:MAG TPA: hypothetical protein VM488_06190 [Pseudobacter sp.]|nr:hypothetical protein [Pseudobacter sp.]
MFSQFTKKEGEMNPKLAVAFVLLVVLFLSFFFYSASQTYPRELYRTQNIYSISLQIDTTLIRIKSPEKIERLTQLMLHSKTRVRSTSGKIISNRVDLKFHLKGDDVYTFYIGNIGKEGNVIDLPFRSDRADSLFQLIDSLYYKFPPGTAGFPLFQNNHK